MLSWLLRQLNVTGDLINHLDQAVFAFHYHMGVMGRRSLAHPHRLVYLHLATPPFARYAA